MKVGDVWVEPRLKKVHVIYAVHDNAFGTLSLPQTELMTWAETPVADRIPRTVELEGHVEHDTKLWSFAPAAVEKWARQYAFSDVSVTVLPMAV